MTSGGGGRHTAANTPSHDKAMETIANYASSHSRNKHECELGRSVSVCFSFFFCLINSLIYY
jgi:hypothetical protein